jgi:hypothetical protein
MISTGSIKTEFYLDALEHRANTDVARAQSPDAPLSVLTTRLASSYNMVCMSVFLNVSVSNQRVFCKLRHASECSLRP